MDQATGDFAESLLEMFVLRTSIGTVAAKNRRVKLAFEQSLNTNLSGPAKFAVSAAATETMGGANTAATEAKTDMKRLVTCTNLCFP
jgi:hypothetical protein